jgi:hypothetical protein
MAWDFQTRPVFQEQLDWAAQFVREEIRPIEPVADTGRGAEGRREGRAVRGDSAAGSAWTGC